RRLPSRPRDLPACWCGGRLGLGRGERAARRARRRLNVAGRAIADPVTGRRSRDVDSEGSVKATDVLRRQHRELLALFEALGDTEDPNERRRLLDEIVDAVDLHAELEERIFYPAVREGDGTRAQRLVREACDEHRVVDLLLAEAPELDPEAESFDETIALLRELVSRHIEREERTLFPIAARLAAEDSAARTDARESTAGR